MNTQVSEAAVADHHHGNGDDVDYAAFLIQLNARFLANTQGGTAPLFKTDVSPDQLWAAYMHSLPEGQRQFHTCSCCRGFIKRYGGLVTIAADGSTASAIWNPEDAPPLYLEAVKHMQGMAQRATVTGPFLSALREWGQHQTGIWQHLSITPPASMVYKGVDKTAGQAMAVKREDFRTVRRALEDISPHVLEQALTLLRADALYRSEKVLGQAEWLHTLQCTLATTPHEVRSANILWRAVSTAPAGFCHPRTSMISTLLEDIEAGLDFADVSRKFKAKMGPLQYQRPQAAPSAGTIAQAEKLMEQLGAAGSLARRYARVDEIEALWRSAAPEAPAAAGGVFSHLQPKDQAAAPASNLHLPVITMTWEKFAKTVLPDAKQIHLKVPSFGHFIGMATAVNADAPPIIQWDLPEARNPVSWYVYHGGSGAHRWGLAAGAWALVTAAALRPHMWRGGGFEHQGKGALFVLQGQRDLHGAHACLFPEILKAEFHGVRSVIEAYSSRAKMEGGDEASANGIDVIGAHVRVSTGAGPAIEYKIDRWD